MPELIVNEIIKEFSTRGKPLSILDGASFELGTGETVAITGPSGSGKSTLLYIVGTLESPTTGSVSLAGQDPFQLNQAELATFRNEQVGFVFQEHHLLPQCSVIENVLLPTIATGKSSNEQVERAKMLLGRVGLSPRLEHRPGELSGGERQRCAIARALINQPKLLLADEPTGNLDRTTAAAVIELLLEMQQQEQTMMVIVTHNPDQAKKMQRQLELNEGKLQSYS